MLSKAENNYCLFVLSAKYIHTYIHTMYLIHLVTSHYTSAVDIYSRSSLYR